MIDIAAAPVVIARWIASISGVIDEIGSDSRIKAYGSSALRQRNLAEAVAGLNIGELLVAHLSTDLQAGAVPWTHSFVVVIRCDSNEDGLRLARKILTGNPEGSAVPFTLTEVFVECDPPENISVTTQVTPDAIEYVQVSFQLLDRS